MKKIFMILAMISCTMTMDAVETFDINDVSIVPEKRTTLEVSLNDVINRFIGFEFKMVLPEGVRIVEGSAKLGSRFVGTDHILGMKRLTEGEDAGAYQFICISYSATPIPDMNGPIVTVELEGEASLSIGETLQGIVTEIEFTTEDAGQSFFNDTSYDISVVKYSDQRVHLEETSVVMPSAAQNVDVTVSRSFKANEWSTIVLPFSMNGSQMKWAFGEDVQLAEFTDYEVDEDNNDISRIRIMCDLLDVSNGMQANYPYLIKVSRDIEEFMIDGVNVVPSSSPSINLGTKWKPKSFIGTYLSNTVVEDGGLFLCNNAFSYSTGATTIKAFRAYFFFVDVPSDYNSETAGNKVSLVFNNSIPTGVDALSDVYNSNDKWYNMEGKKINAPKKKGIYIKNRKKTIVKQD